MIKKYICARCEKNEVDNLFDFCDSCQQERQQNKERAMASEAKEIIHKMYDNVIAGMYSNANTLPWDIVLKQPNYKTIQVFNIACKLAIEVLAFTRGEIIKAIGALILDGVFESENDSGIAMMTLFIRDYDRQIEYIRKEFL